MSSFASFVIAALAVWRLTHLLHAEDGPWDLAARWRARLGQGESALGRMVGCFYCLSVWVALPLVPWLAEGVFEGLIVWAALSGAAILLERVSGAFERHALPAPESAMWHEEPLDRAEPPAAPSLGTTARPPVAPREPPD